MSDRSMARCTVVPGTRPDAETKQALEDVLTQIASEIAERRATEAAAHTAEAAS